MAKKLSDDGEAQGIDPKVLLHHYQRIRAARRAKDKAVQEAQTERSRFTAVVKAAKKAGVNMRGIELKEEFEDLGLDGARELLATVAQYTAWDGNGEQLQMFEGLAEEPEAQPDADLAAQHARERAWQAGYAHAQSGGSIDECTFIAGTEFNQAWTVGFRDQQAGNEPMLASTEPVEKPKKASTRRGMPKATDSGEPGPPVPLAADGAAIPPLH